MINRKIMIREIPFQAYFHQCREEQRGEIHDLERILGLEGVNNHGVRERGNFLRDHKNEMVGMLVVDHILAHTLVRTRKLVFDTIRLVVVHIDQVDHKPHRMDAMVLGM